MGGYIWWFEYYWPVSFVEVAQDRAELMDGIESYVRVDDFLAQLTRRSLSFEVRRPQPTPAQTRRPPYSITMVIIRQFSHLGFSGELTVTFFNDRLLGLRFFPSDIDGYLTQLLSKKSLDLRTQREARPSANTRVYLATEHSRGRYIGWVDVRLDAEISLWIKRYS